MNYRYPHVSRAILHQDAAFRGRARPGKQLPDFDFPTIGGGRLRRDDFLGRQPLLLICT